MGDGLGASADIELGEYGAGVRSSRPHLSDTTLPLGSGGAPVDRLSVTTNSIRSVPNGSSNVINVDNDIDVPPIHRSYATPPTVRHQLDSSMFGNIACHLSFQLIGVLVGLPAILLLTLCALIAAPFRLVIILLMNLRPLRILLFGRESIAEPLFKLHCDPYWPLGEHRVDVAQCVLTLQNSLNINDVRQQIYERVIGKPTDGARPYFPYYSATAANGGHSGGCCCNCGRCSTTRWDFDPTFQISKHIIRHEDASTNPVTNLKQLEIYLNNPPPLPNGRSPWSIVLFEQFGDAQEGTACSLAVLHIDSRLTNHLCIPRLLSLWTESRLVFDCEPKVRRSSSSAVAARLLPPYSTIVTFGHNLVHLAKQVTVGPLCIAIALFKRNNRVWGDCRHIDRHRTKHFELAPHRSSKTSSSAVSADRHSSSLCSSSLISNGPSHPMSAAADRSRMKVTWCRIPNVDLLFRAERILRAATVDMFLAFAAGALRRHFRAQGIKHPPNTVCSMPVSNREFLPVCSQQPCDFCLVPVLLPTGVEGAIPRIWEVQRQLNETFDRCFPSATRLVRSLLDIAVPASACRRMMRSIHRQSGCTMSIMRASGNVSVDGRRLHSMLMYVPVPDGVSLAFTFIQCGTEIVASVAADSAIFNDPDRLLGFLQAEIHNLLNQLSVRLLTLSQATFLPPMLPLASAIASPGQQVTLSTPPPHLVEHNLSPSTDAVFIDGRHGDASHLQQQQPHRPTELSPPSLSTGIAMAAKRDSTASASHISAASSHDDISKDLSIRDDRPSTSRQKFSSGQLSEYSGELGEEASLEELELLLETVNNELESMKSNPQGDRAEYLAKLSKLERKMESFHRTISRRLGTSMPIEIDQDSTAADDFLGPYRDDQLSTNSPHRRDSSRSGDGGGTSRRDSAVMKLIRRRSKRIDSPTRRISPKLSIDAGHPIQSPKQPSPNPSTPLLPHHNQTPTAAAASVASRHQQRKSAASLTVPANSPSTSTGSVLSSL